MTEATKPTGEPSQPSNVEVTDGPWNMSVEKFMESTGNMVTSISETVANAAKTVSKMKPWEMPVEEFMKMLPSRDTPTQYKPAVEAYKASPKPLEGIKQGLYHTPEKITPALQRLKALYDEKLIPAESSGKHYKADGETLTKSKVGALGISQIMPATAEKPGYGIKPLQDQSEEEYRRLGFDLLVAYEKKYKGDTRKALAAYNYGPGNVDKIINKARREGVNWERKLPLETRNYVQKIAGK